MGANKAETGIHPLPHKVSPQMGRSILTRPHTLPAQCMVPNFLIMAILGHMHHQIQEYPLLYRDPDTLLNLLGHIMGLRMHILHTHPNSLDTLGQTAPVPQASLIRLNLISQLSKPVMFGMERLALEDYRTVSESMFYFTIRYPNSGNDLGMI